MMDGFDSVSAVPWLVDNKREHMEKALSPSKRDQILMNSAKEDLIIKKQMIASLEDSNMQKMTVTLCKRSMCTSWTSYHSSRRCKNNW